MRLIADGTVEREGVPGLARRLGYSERHLNRLLTEELGAGPLAIARANRAHTARLLIETTAMPLTDVAFAAGFGSVRQFNDTINEVFASAPSALRAAAAVAPGPSSVARPTAVDLRLPTRQPFAGQAALSFLGVRAIPGIEAWDGTTYRRSLGLPAGQGVVDLVAHDDHIAACVRLESWSDLAVAVQRVRRLLDLDNDPEAVDSALVTSEQLGPLIRRQPGRRALGSMDPFETAVRAVVGQQVSVAGARTVAGRVVGATGHVLQIDDEQLTHVFPEPGALADASDDAFSMPTTRRDTIRRMATAVAGGAVQLHAGADPQTARQQLLELKGIGPWTANYVVMRGLGHPDTFLATDLGVRHALEAMGATAQEPAKWAPWRSYAVHHLWASLG